MKKIVAGAVAGLLLLALNGRAQAAPEPVWPTRPIHWIVPYPAGGSTDLIARIVGQKISMKLGQPVVVENRAGAGGNIGTDAVAKAEPDGYTMVMGNIGPIAINVSLYTKLPYDPANDLAPVSLLASVPNLLVVNPEFPASTVKELIELARAKPGALSFASPGIGTSLHLSGELFNTMAGVKVQHVPYRGSAPGLNDTIAGHVPIMFDNMPSALPFVQSGRLRALAITSAARSEAAPDVPTMAEAGLPGYEVGGWFGVLVPARTPQPIIDRLHREFVAALQDPEVRTRLTDLGASVVGSTPEAFGAFIRAEIEKWRRVVQAADIKAE